jgi:hypothetical protein
MEGVKIGRQQARRETAATRGRAIHVGETAVAAVCRLASHPRRTTLRSFDLNVARADLDPT